MKTEIKKSIQNSTRLYKKIITIYYNYIPDNILKTSVRLYEEILPARINSLLSLLGETETYDTKKLEKDIQNINFEYLVNNFKLNKDICVINPLTEQKLDSILIIDRLIEGIKTIEQNLVDVIIIGEIELNKKK